VVVESSLSSSGCGLLLEELRQIGFKLHVGDVERRLVSNRCSKLS
jgi:hypothetical protein